MSARIARLDDRVELTMNGTASTGTVIDVDEHNQTVHVSWDNGAESWVYRVTVSGHPSPMLRVLESETAERAGYDFTLMSSGDGWMGTYAIVLRAAVTDILDDGPYGPVELTLADGNVITGTLRPVDDPNAANMISVDGVLHVIDDVIGFRA